MLARDVSNYTVDVLPVERWKAEGVGLVLVQAFPPSYRQYAEQRAQMRACAAAELPFDCYVYDYLADPTWLAAALQGIEQANAEEKLLPRKVWLDEEDVETANDWAPEERAITILERASTTYEWGARYTPQIQVGIYTGEWWWRARTESEMLASWPLWVAQYDGVADASVFHPFGGWNGCAIKQYAGTQADGTDLNVLSEEEASDLNVTDEERAQMQATIDGLVTTVADIADRLGDQLLAEAKRTSVRKTEVRRIVAEMEAERVQAVGPRP